MLELGFSERSFMPSTTRPRHRSPDSVILAIESNFSLFSSTSASADRSSITSDAHEHDSLVFRVSQHLAECGPRESSSLPYPDQSKPSTVRHISRPLTKAYKLEECLEKRSRSEAILHRQRPVSLDMNNVAISSPGLGAMKQASIASKATGVFPSPGTPHYRYNNPGIQKGWSSERVASHAISNRRRITTTILPYNNGRTLPSKWEDAERWIFSPGSVDRGIQPSLPPPQRRPKSKSGPLGPPGVSCYSLYSPLVPIPNRGNGGSAAAMSSFPAGIVDGASASSVGAFLSQPEPCMTRSASVNMCSELLCLPPVPPPEVNDATNNGLYAVSRRDMATQMSPDGSLDLSPKGRPLFSSSTLSGLPIFENGPSSKSEIRDVQVDGCVKMIRWSKKNKSRNSIMENANGWIEHAAKTESAAPESIQTAKCIAKAKREEAKIAAWENLQKAKAEEAIRKLEVKLEKKRSSSMDKIMKKLRSAQKHAQGMRNSVLASRASSVSVRSVLSNSISRSSISSARQVGSLGSCFTCRGG